MNEYDVIIVGAGLSGLVCAKQLVKAGCKCCIVESSDDVGGRARTDIVEGFRLDRGFQVLLTAYPEARQALDYDKLNLRPFVAGALVRYRGKFHRFSDPLREPFHVVSTLFSPLATFGDKLRMLLLKNDVGRMSLEEIYARPESKTVELLRDRGFSQRVIEAFFRPFLGGVFLDRNLETSSRMFEFVFKNFSEGSAALPANGMGEIAHQLAADLPPGSIRLNSKIQRVEKNVVITANGERMHAKSIVVATDSPSAAKLFATHDAVDLSNEQQERLPRSVTCIYFSADRPPITEPILVLNGEGRGPINNLCIPSQVSQSYAPKRKSLISISVIGDPKLDDVALEVSVRNQLIEWFGAKTNEWRHLKTYRISYALPNQTPPYLSTVQKPLKRDDGIFVCGDYLDTASIQGAMASGRRAAETILANVTFLKNCI